MNVVPVDKRLLPVTSYQLKTGLTAAEPAVSVVVLPAQIVVDPVTEFIVGKGLTVIPTGFV